MNGFINFYKNSGLTSNRALEKVKKTVRLKKAGYLGTLDPFATGILPVALGLGTKLFSYFEEAPKKYTATIVFGFETDTQDSTGKKTLTSQAPQPDEREKLEETLNKFLGEIEQVPPMFSAKKINGRRLYELAREGKSVERQAKTVTIHSIELKEFSGETAVFTAEVSRGTYLRTLCEDIGRQLGYRAHLGGLERTKVHIFSVEDSVNIDTLEENSNNPEKWLLPLDYPFLKSMPKFDASLKDKTVLLMGQEVQWTGKESGFVRLYDNKSEFFGIGRADAVLRQVSPQKILAAGTKRAQKSASAV
ncbi:MAG: hypothetical protein IEMM0002_1446 [bacterium]|nr:MAG: hypothetical protein IEMM0002_1446 [bacterium]